MASKIVGEAARILGDVDSDGIWGPVTATLDWCEVRPVLGPHFEENIVS